MPDEARRDEDVYAAILGVLDGLVASGSLDAVEDATGPSVPLRQPSSRGLVASLERGQFPSPSRADGSPQRRDRTVRCAITIEARGRSRDDPDAASSCDRAYAEVSNAILAARPLDESCPSWRTVIEADRDDPTLHPSYRRSLALRVGYSYETSDGLRTTR